MGPIERTILEEVTNRGSHFSRLLGTPHVIDTVLDFLLKASLLAKNKLFSRCQPAKEREKCL